ncbi:MAG TPA: GTPase [Gemmataceae bacterium]
MSQPPTTFTVLTPPGAAAVAVIGLAGPRAWDVVRERFRPVAAASLPAEPTIDRFWLGGFAGDAVILAIHDAGPSPAVELHCHGGPEVVRQLTEELARNGLRPDQGTGFVRASGPADTALELARAPTLRTAGILLDQLNGAFHRAVAALDAALAAYDASAARDLAAALAQHAPLGRHLTRPWQVVIAGAPNVGKSSLVNGLAGFTRSVVTAVPGTTRDVVTTATAMDGWPVELLDTADQHDAADELEGQGIARARTAAGGADLCLWVVDGTVSPVWPAITPANCLPVVNKADLPTAWDVASVPDAVVVSARTGAGLDELCRRISRRLVRSPPPPGAAVPFTPGLADLTAAIAATLDVGDTAAARALIAPVAQPL